MKRILMISILLICIAYFLKGFNENEFKILVNNINDKNIMKPNFKYNDLITTYTIEELAHMKLSKSVVCNSYERDVEYLISTLKYNYAPYKYIGEEQFEMAKQNILDRLKEDKITKEAFTQILIEELAFIQDSHFLIQDNMIMTDKFIYHYDPEFYYKDKNGFFKIKNKSKEYLITVNGDENIENYLKRTIDQEGKLAYQIGILSNIQGRELKIDITCRNQRNVYKDRLKLKFGINAGDTSNTYNKTLFVQEEIDKIPVVTMCHMAFEYGENKDVAQDILKSAEDMRKEKVFILDLRGNGGGNSVLPSKWIYNYCGQVPNSNGIHLSLNTFKLNGQNDFVDSPNNPYYINL